jgi:hypothetical protein
MRPEIADSHQGQGRDRSSNRPYRFAHPAADQHNHLAAGGVHRLSYCRVSARDRVRSSFQAKASSRSSPARSGRCRSLLLAGALQSARYSQR